MKNKFTLASATILALGLLTGESSARETYSHLRNNQPSISINLGALSRLTPEPSQPPLKQQRQLRSRGTLITQKPVQPVARTEYAPVPVQQQAAEPKRSIKPKIRKHSSEPERVETVAAPVPVQNNVAVAPPVQPQLPPAPVPQPVQQVAKLPDQPKAPELPAAPVLPSAPIEPKLEMPKAEAPKPLPPVKIEPPKMAAVPAPQFAPPSAPVASIPMPVAPGPKVVVSSKPAAEVEVPQVPAPIAEAPRRPVLNPDAIDKAAPEKIVDLPQSPVIPERPAPLQAKPVQPKITMPEAPKIPTAPLRAPELPAPPALKAEPPKLELPKPEAPKLEAPKLEVPKLEMPKPEVPKVEAPKLSLPEAPKLPDVPKLPTAPAKPAEMPKLEMPEAPKLPPAPDLKAPELPKLEAPKLPFPEPPKTPELPGRELPKASLSSPIMPPPPPPAPALEIPAKPNLDKPSIPKSADGPSDEEARNFEEMKRKMEAEAADLSKDVPPAPTKNAALPPSRDLPPLPAPPPAVTARNLPPLVITQAGEPTAVAPKDLEKPNIKDLPSLDKLYEKKNSTAAPVLAPVPPALPAEKTIASKETVMVAPQELPKQVAPETSGATVSMPYGEAEIELPLSEKPRIDSLIAQLQADKSARVTVVAYASGTPEQASQAKRTALARALAVRTYLMERNISSDRMDIRPLGNKAVTGIPDRVDIIIGKTGRS